MADNAAQKLIEAAEATANAARALAEAAAALPQEGGAMPMPMQPHGEMMADAAAAAAHGATGVDPFVFRLAIFVLAIFVGYYVVWSVTPALHTPLMAVTNAISSVIVVGALIAVGADVAQGASSLTGIFGFIALVLASVNIFGGFLVTERMLAMYKKKG
jgi:NAD(P) transhydrogenase subunit alpha